MRLLLLAFIYTLGATAQFPSFVLEQEQKTWRVLGEQTELLSTTTTRIEQDPTGNRLLRFSSPGKGTRLEFEDASTRLRWKLDPKTKKAISQDFFATNLEKVRRTATPQAIEETREISGLTCHVIPHRFGPEKQRIGFACWASSLALPLESTSTLPGKDGASIRTETRTTSYTLRAPDAPNLHIPSDYERW